MENLLHTGHRKRLKEKFLKANAESFADYELLELFLFLTHPRKDLKPDSKILLKKYHNLPRLFSQSLEELTSNNEISANNVIYLKLFKEITRRIVKAEIIDKPILNSIDKLIDYLRISIGHEEVEHFIVLYLNKKNMLIEEEKISFGTVDQTAFYPREVIKKALSYNATAIIIVHNHPSNNSKPSSADIAITNELQQIANSLNIILHDHIIITSDNYYSFKQHGLIQ